jgi:hypothetical protein
MKGKHSLLLLSSLLCGVRSFAQDKPLFKEVAAMYFSHYAFADFVSYNLVFMKKRDGWYTADRSPGHPSVYKHIQLFWSDSSRTWLPLDYPSAKDSSEKAVAEAVAGYMGFYTNDLPAYNYEYDHCVYHGYPNWDIDIIKDYGGRAALDAAGLESLARAYGHYAGSFFYDVDSRHGGTDPKDLYGESPKDNFIGYEKMALDSYNKLRQQYPTYPTLWGNIAIKCGNEYLYAYSTLLVNGFEDEAKKFLAPGIYPDSFVRVSRLYFDGLEPNSLLITTKDNDTYPLWYLQEAQHYRPDLTIVNYALLESGAYLAYLDKRYHGLFRTSEMYYKKRDFEMSLLDNFFPCKGPSLLGPWLDSVNTSDQVMNEVREDGVKTFDDSMRRYQCMDVYVDLRPGILRLKLNEALLNNDFMLLDIFNTNIGKRAIYFTDPKEPWLFSPHLRQKSKVYYAAAD